MIRGILVSAALLIPLTSQAGELHLDDLKSQHATQLSKEELMQLIPGAKVVSGYHGATRRWKNPPGGKFIATSDVRREATSFGKQSNGQGSWHIGDNGTYCVTIEWPQRTENWCKYIFQVDGKYYGVKSLSDGAAEANEFAFSH